MKGDLSRNTFDRARHYSSVRLQQGRVVTDADWNEQADLTRNRAEVQARDTIGACGAPLAAAGYALVAETNALAVHAVNANVAWIAAEDGLLLQTSNGGADWSVVDLNTTANLHGLQQVGGVGWAVGDSGTVRKTTNQGATWSSQNPGTVNALRGVCVFDADHAWAVGDGGIVVATSDGGASWTLVTTDASRLYAVAFVDELAGLAVGQAGTIVSTTDGGQTWTGVASATTAHLRALAVFGTTLAWAAGQRGTIIRSADGGATWQQSTTPSDATLYAIVFRDQNEGWAAGEGGVLLHSTDGGVSWLLENVGTQANLRSLSFFGNDAGWLVGDGSTALRIASGSPDVARIVLPSVNLSIEPGRCYVYGTLCELEVRASYAHQPDGGASERLAPGGYLMYLDAWQRHISALEAPPIREVALGGPDTTTRAQTVAQVRALTLPLSSPFDWNCGSTLAMWDALVNAPPPVLAARAQPQLAAASLCDIAATAGYQRLENQLYRVEVHEGGANPTFKWSRENGSVAFAVVSVTVEATQQQTIVKLAARGRDANLDLAIHDRVELIDDDAELSQRAGVFFEYLSDGSDELEVVLAGIPTGTLGQDPTRHPILRRWDHKPDVPGTNVLPIVEGSWIELEDGVQVQFGPGGQYRPGDYWQIPARTITGDVEWPRNDDGDPIARPPSGIKDAYCRLGIIEVAADGGVTVVGDCRKMFPPLTAMEQLLYVSGDGQEAAPNAMLPQPLAVRVARGSLPLPGRTVRFDVETGGGTVGSGSQQLEILTDTDGQAQCEWLLGASATAPGRFQRVRASFIDGDGQPLAGQFVVFCATASLSLRYVSGDGQDAAPGTALPFPLEVQVVNGADGIAGVVLHATIEQGGGAIVGPDTLTTDSQGQAAFGWQLGPGGPQRTRVDLLDSQGQVIERVSFDATASVSVTRGCQVTIGVGGDFPQLDGELLQALLTKGGGSLCICFMPGTHELPPIEIQGFGKFRLSIHGCGHASLLTAGGPLTFANFAALELRDLVMSGAGTNSLLLRNNNEVRLDNVLLERLGDATGTALSIVGAHSVSVTGCEIVTQPQTMAAVFQEIIGTCRVIRNRFVGMVSFYGEITGGLTQDILLRLAAVKNPAILPAPGAELSFCDNELSQLAIATELVTALLGANPMAPGVFANAVLRGNTITAMNNVFVAGLLGFATNAFTPPVVNSTMYGVMMAQRATAVGNLGSAPNTQLFDPTVHFVVSVVPLAQAANVINIT
jgi:photosystem II stability/assembly factor-like uncharacterized protein